MHLGLNPMHRKRDEAHADFGVVALYRLHEANVALLNKVGLRQAVAGIRFSEVYNETEVRKNQLARRIDVIVIIVLLGEFELVLWRQNSDAIDRRHVGRQVSSWRVRPKGRIECLKARPCISLEGCAHCVVFLSLTRGV